jgi:hypothetical protein
VERSLLIQIYGCGELGKQRVLANGKSDIGEGVNQSKKSDSVDKKAMLSSTKMGQFHPTHPHFSAYYSLNHIALRTQIPYLLY